MFCIKICGVRLESDVRAVADAGADAIGLNFFPPSVRALDPDSDATQRVSREAQRRGLLRVGLFVDEPVAAIVRVAQTVGLDAIQLHGNEPLAVAIELKDAGFLVIRAIKLPTGRLSLQQIIEATEPTITASVHPLLDVDGGVSHGGTGQRLDWETIGQWSASMPARSWTLAGGLNPENVAEALRITGATSVDVASGVESTRGVKDAAMIRRFASVFLGN